MNKQATFLMRKIRTSKYFFNKCPVTRTANHCSSNKALMCLFYFFLHRKYLFLTVSSTLEIFLRILSKEQETVP